MNAVTRRGSLCSMRLRTRTVTTPRRFGSPGAAFRLTHQPLPLPDDIAEAQRWWAPKAHWTLYALLVIQPLLGWAGSSAFPAPVIVFGLFNLPMIAPASRALSDQLLFVHRSTDVTIACLVTVHIAATIYHHFVRRDGVLMRMITG